MVSRWSLYWILIAVALGAAGGRIATVIHRDGKAAFLSANDRSRWCTITALVEEGTYEIDALQEDPVWQSIDRVRHQNRAGKMRFYSSKPPLYPTILAGVYWVALQLGCTKLSEDPIGTVRLLTAIINLPQLFVLILATLGAVENLVKHQRSQVARKAMTLDEQRSGALSIDWAAYFVAIAACVGTMLLPMTISLNNHLPAAASIAIALWALTRPTESFGWTSCLLGGIASGFAAANELPALSMLCLFLFVALIRHPLGALVGFAPGVLVVAAAFFGTNVIAHQSLRPPYMHRGVGEEMGRWDAESDTSPDEGDVRQMLNSYFPDGFREEIHLFPSGVHNRWIVEAKEGQQLFAITKSGITPSEGDGTNASDALPNGDKPSWVLHLWDDWYEYPESYWRYGNRKGVDAGEEDQWVYVFHATIGHHGLFSLTPNWILAVLGCVIIALSGNAEQRLTAVSIAIASVVCFAFYMMRPEIDRNYGGVSCCFRWMLWFAPLWLWACWPAVFRAAGHPIGRWFCTLLMMMGVFSVMTSITNPWQHPWIYRILEHWQLAW